MDDKPVEVIQIDPGADNPDDARHFAPGTFGCQEALFLAELLTRMVSRDLLEHPTIRTQPHWRAIALDALDSLVELYEEIGRAHFEAPYHGDVK